MPPSRRRLLHALAGVTAGLAGCADLADPAVDRPTPGPRGERVRPLAVVAVRRESPDPLVTDEDGDARDAHLTSAEEANELAFADDDAAARLAAAVEETDFERHSLFLHQQTVGECYRVHLTEVSRRDDSVHFSFCRELRGANDACTKGKQVRVGYAIRLPFAGDDFSGMGIGFSHGCSPNAADAVRTQGGDG